MPIEYSAADIARYYGVRMPSLKQQGKEWRGPCPVHKGTRDSFAVNPGTGMACCHSSCDRGWDIIALEQELGGKNFLGAKTDLYAILGRAVEEFKKIPKHQIPRGPIDTVYNYTDEHGSLLYQVVRYRDPKSFSQRRPSGIPNEFIAGLGDVQTVPYNLPSVIASNKLVFVCEGERDGDNLAKLELTATSNSGGAEHFKPELARWFVDKRVCIIPDNDDKGRKHAAQVASILSPVVKSIKILTIPGLPEKGDVSDFLESGGTLEQLRTLYSECPHYDP